MTGGGQAYVVLPVIEERPDAAESATRQEELELLAAAVRELPDRCRRVLTLRLLYGLSHKEIAANLHLSVKTVETYRVRVGEKLGLRSRTQMVQYAVRQGWLTESRPMARPAL